MESSIKVTDDTSKAVQKTPNRISLDDIKSRIANTFFFNLGDVLDRYGQPVSPDQKVMTVCILTMDNGYTFIGRSAPADAANYDREVGEQFSYEDAIRQIWPVMGFELKTLMMMRGRDHDI